MKLYNYMLKLQMKARQYGGAVQTTNKILQQDPKNVKVLLMRSKAQYNNGEYNGALKSVQQALQVSKGSESAKAQLYFQYGISAKKAGRLDEAKKAFKKAASNGALKHAAINEMKTMEQ